MSAGFAAGVTVFHKNAGQNGNVAVLLRGTEKGTYSF
jgi:hypothetical protein